MYTVHVRGRSSSSQTAGRPLRAPHHHVTILAKEVIDQLPSRATQFSLFQKVPPAVSTEIHPSIGRCRVADDVSRRGARRLSNVRAPLARVVSGGTLQPGALGSHGGKVGRTLVGRERLSVNDRQVEPRLAGAPVDRQLQLVLVGIGHFGVWRALHDGADVVLQNRISGQVQYG